jgi:hypothetical protein
MYDFCSGFVTGQPELPPSEERREHMYYLKKPEGRKAGVSIDIAKGSPMDETIAASLYVKLKEFLRTTENKSLIWHPEGRNVGDKSLSTITTYKSFNGHWPKGEQHE